MKIHGDYEADGYALIEGLIPAEIASALLAGLQTGLGGPDRSFTQFRSQELLTRHSTIEIPGHSFFPLLTFLWGLTPIVSQLTGRDLLPSYDYFRVYQKDDICRLHTDRASCEHSLSMTLAYSDKKTWPLDIAKNPSEGPVAKLDEQFEDEPYNSIAMKPGDAVLYRGVERRHGRVTPNPNRSSAHLFLHYVEREGVHKDHAFDAVRLDEVRRQQSAYA